MKATIDLPEELVREMKMQAARQGRKLKDVAAEIFQRGLERLSEETNEQPRSLKLDQPLFVCEDSNAKAPSMTLEALLELERQAELEEDARRARGPI